MANRSWLHHNRTSRRTRSQVGQPFNRGKSGSSSSSSSASSASALYPCTRAAAAEAMLLLVDSRRLLPSSADRMVMRFLRERCCNSSSRSPD